MDGIWDNSESALGAKLRPNPMGNTLRRATERAARIEYEGNCEHPSYNCPNMLNNGDCKIEKCYRTGDQE